VQLNRSRAPAFGARLARACAAASLLGLMVQAGPRPARAEVQAATHLTIFTEPSSANEGVRVYHPQTEVGASTSGFGIAAGYEMDIVSGATARVYAPGDPDAVSGATFSDTRQTAHGALSFETAAVALAGGYSYGWENDYKSHTLTVTARGDFLERNFSLSLGYTRNFDSVCDQANALAETPLERQALSTSEGCFDATFTDLTTRKLTINSFEPALSWTATPLLLVQAGATLQILDGFQSNPYRRVRIGGQGREPQETLPQFRQRYAVFVRAHQAIPLLKSSVRAGGRLYRDTWDVVAGSADLEYLQYLGPSIIVGARGRYHQQTGAAFFRTANELRTLGPTGKYWTGDRELAPLTNIGAGGKLSYVRHPPPDAGSWMDDLEVNMRFDVLFYRGSDQIPNADRKRAMIFQAGAELHF
jgi:hypothetical protein